MATNQYVNKVVYGSTTLIDISDTTAVASDVASGKYFYNAAGAKVQGTASSGAGGSAVTITDVADSHGGTVRTITAVDISQDTVTAAHLESGYTAHDAQGNSITGTLPSGGGTDFFVNLIWNTQTNLWEPDKTLAEIVTANTAGKTISTYAELNYYPIPTDGLYDQGDNAFYFDIHVPGHESGADFHDILWGILDANGITNELLVREYDTRTATALPADVSNGKIFFNANGQQIGTLIPSSAPTLQAKTNIVPTESSQTIQADSGFDGLSSVQINAVSSTYVGSGITRRSSTDLTASGATVTVPAGYYSEQASKAVASGTEGTPTATKGTVSNHAISVTPSVTNSAGYIAGGTHNGTAVTVSASELVSGTLNISSSGTKDVTNYASVSVPAGTVTAPSSISGTSASVSVGTNTLTFTKTVSVTPNVTTAGYISSGTAGNASVSLQASVTTQAAQTIHPSTTDQTISASRYLSGAQTIKAVTHNLDASKILSGTTVNIGDSTDSDCVASVTGTLTFQTIYSGSSAPSSSTGVNGDIYVQA